MKQIEDWIISNWIASGIILLLILGFVIEQIALRILSNYFTKEKKLDEHGEYTREYRMWRLITRISIAMTIFIVIMLTFQMDGAKSFFHSNVEAVAVVMIIVGGVTLNRILPPLIKEFFDRSSEVIKVDPTQYKFFRHAMQGFIVLGTVALVVLQIPELKSLANTIFAGAGVLALVFGLASQQAFSNIVSGVFVVIFKPFRVGDTIKVGVDVSGTVEDITLRHTVIRDFENRRVIIPNSSISTQTITNFNITDEKVCRFLEMNLAFDVDLRKAIAIMREEVQAHPDFYDNRSDQEKEDGQEAVNVRVLGYNDAGARVRVYVWGKDPGTSFGTYCDLNISLMEKLEAAGIKPAYPSRVMRQA